MPVSAPEPLCPHCGVDLALAAVLMERLALSVIPAEPGTPFVGDAMLSRFGEFLMKKGYITQAQLDSALARQGELSARKGRRETLGQVLLEMAVMTREQLELASVEQVQELQTALRQVNVQLEQRVAERTRELQQAYKRLTELDRLKTNFVSNISHELRTPLTKIKGFSSLLVAGDLGPMNEDQTQAVAVMARGVEELERLIADLIQFATGARGEMSLTIVPAGVAPMIESVVAGASERAQRRGVHLTAHVGPGVGQAMGDAERIRWVMNQLVGNAIKFTPQGGHVTVSAGLVDQRVRWSVADTGPGIPDDKLAELFKPFHQLDGSATRQQGGTGLGLALVKMIVEAHDSHVTVETAVGEGCRFSFDLPAVAP
ncbi:MAG: ATP-binding protein [Vicinamibacterales bacterium]|nr:ATP-binding protein [Vicinamibacterales bacterium]